MTVGGDPFLLRVAGVHSAVAVDSELVLRLARRKNKQHGSVLWRACCCAHSNKWWLCPVHTLGRWLSMQLHGARPFAGLRADTARQVLKQRLGRACVEEASSYVLHDFRRGHAMDIAAAGGDLRAILTAGRVVIACIPKLFGCIRIGEEVALQAHLDDSDECDE